MKLPNAVREAFDEFDAATREYGREACGGLGGKVEAEALKRYDVAKDNLFKAINTMRRNDRRREKKEG